MTMQHLVQTAGFDISYLQSGRGTEPVVLVHASTSSPSQWRALLETAPLLDRSLRLLAPALSGYGETRARIGDLPDANQDVDVLTQFIDTVCPRRAVHLVGHSYGAATALAVASAGATCQRVESLTLIEPVRFNLLRHLGFETLYQDIHTISHHQIDLVKAGRLEDAAHSFVRYWSGVGAWARMSPAARSNLRRLMPKVASEWRLIWRWDKDLTALSRVSCPVQFISGARSTPAALAVTQCLRALLADTRSRTIADAGHQAPITHPGTVNRWVLDHVRDARFTRPAQHRLAAG